MKVAHNDDYDTHAIIGGKKIEEFGIAQTAEFFTVLSDTMYSNKPLAVIREVLCNAWDSHIVSGNTDKPVIVNITEDQLSIRDFGHGIPHELLHQIYCVYGISTKENDGNQTGGFGLGSKSPFAYTTHFTVNNHYNGIKAINAISRGSALTKGKPDRRIIHEVPTTESGVEVVIPIKNDKDKNLFIEITQDIASFGEMNVLLNGKLINTVPISKAEGNLFLTNRPLRTGQSRINIRYGNVIYPVDYQPEYAGPYNKLMELIKGMPSTIPYNQNDLVMIIQAPPNSISVTPSRESVSVTETTINTLNKLFNEMIDFIENGKVTFEEKLLEEQEKAIRQIWKDGKQERIMFVENLLQDEDTLTAVLPFHKDFTIINSMTTLADYYLRYQKHFSKETTHKLLVQKIQLQIQLGFRQKHNLIRYLKILKRGRQKGQSMHTWQGQSFTKQIMYPLLKRMLKHPVLNHRSLHVVTGARYNKFGWASLEKYTPDPSNIMTMLQGVVIVTHSRMAYEEDYTRVAKLDKEIPSSHPRLVYVAPRTKGHKEEAIALFQKMGYRVVYFASMMDAYREKNAIPKEQRVYDAPARVKKVGLVKLSDGLTSKGNFDVINHLRENATRSTDYDYVIKPYRMAADNYRDRLMFEWGNEYAADIVSLFGSKIGICVNEPQYDSQIKKGKKDGIRFIVEQVVQKVLTSASIRTYVEQENKHKSSNANYGYLVYMAEHSSVLKKAFNLPDPAPTDDVIYYHIFQHLVSRYARDHSIKPDAKSFQALIWDARDEVKTWKTSQAYQDLEEVVKNSVGIDYLDVYDMKIALQNMSKTKPDYQKRVFIETTIINALAF